MSDLITCGTMDGHTGAEYDVSDMCSDETRTMLSVGSRRHGRSRKARKQQFRESVMDTKLLTHVHSKIRLIVVTQSL